MYYRYYVFSTTTGADHIFYYRSTYSKRKTLYPYRPWVPSALITRDDTIGVLEQYLITAYGCLKKTRLMDSDVSPSEDLKVMTEFWQQFHDGQDKITICLEIQQRLLYDYCRSQLLQAVSSFESQMEGVRMKGHVIFRELQIAFYNLKKQVFTGLDRIKFFHHPDYDRA